MDKISLFKNAGLPLKSISLILDKKGDELNSTLEHRLFSINNEIQELRNQQKVILRILENESFITNSRVITKELWVSILEAAGLDEMGMKKWHVEFEKTSPEAHQDFLESLGIEKDEIILIRKWSKIDENICQSLNESM